MIRCHLEGKYDKGGGKRKGKGRRKLRLKGKIYTKGNECILNGWDIGVRQEGKNFIREVGRVKDLYYKPSYRPLKELVLVG